MAEWRALLDADTSTEEPYLTDVELGQSLNPFGDYTILVINDFNGNRYGEYTKGRRVDVESKAENSSTWETQLAGFVVERREQDDGAGVALEVELYSLDHLLRRGDVRAPLSGQSMKAALQQIIQDFTPLAWNDTSKLIDIGNPQSITRDFLYERVDDVLGELAAMSANETYGVNADGEFYFRPREGERVARGIDESHFFGYKREEKSQEETNISRVYYGGGDKLVTVSDDQSRKAYQDELGTTDPVNFTESVNNRDIDNQNDARAFGNDELEDRSDTTQEEVITYGLLDAEPGDTIDANVPDAGLDGEYLIAKAVYKWAMDESQLTLVDITGNQDNIIKRLSDTLKRVEMRGTSAPEDLESNIRVVEAGGIGENSGVIGTLDVTGSIDNESLLQDSTVTNTGLRKIRDGWGNQSTLTITEIALGTSAGAPSRTATSLESESERVSATVSTSGSDTVDVSNSSSFSTGDDVRTVGLFDSAGDLILVGRVGAAVSGPSNATVSVQVNDDETTESVLTETGQELTRDIIADNSPNYVDRIAVGSGTTATSESDTSLATQEATQDISFVSSGDTNEWFSRAQDNVGANEPIVVEPSGSNRRVALVQTCFTVEDTDLYILGESLTSISNDDFSGGTGVENDSIQEILAGFDLGYEIPADRIGVAVRGKTPSGVSNPQDLFVENYPDAIGDVTIDSTLQWYEATGTPDDPLSGDDTIGINLTTDGSVQIDCVAIFDTDYHSVTDFDNSNDGSGGYLDTPQNNPDQKVVDFGTKTVGNQVTTAKIISTWNDTSNDAALEVNGVTVDNQSTAEFSFAASGDLSVTATLSNYGSSSGTPQTGANGQEITDFNVYAGLGGTEPTAINALKVQASIPPGTLDGTELTELGQMTQSGGLATRSTFAGVLIGQSVQVEIVDNIRWKNVGRLVNQAVFETEITGQEEIPASEIEDQSNYQVVIEGTDII